MSSEIVLRTPRLSLRPFRRADLDDLYAYRSRPDVLRYLDAEAMDRRHADDLLRRWIVLDRLVSPGDTLVLAAELAGRVIGDVSLVWTSAEHRQGDISCVVHPEVQGRGLAGEAVSTLLDLALGPVGLHRVTARCEARNDAAAAVALRLGLRLEAHLVHHRWAQDSWVDDLVFAVLDEEWHDLRRPGPRL